MIQVFEKLIFLIVNYIVADRPGQNIEKTQYTKNFIQG